MKNLPPMPYEEEEEEEKHDTARCGFKKVALSVDPFDRERNPPGGLGKYPMKNDGGRQVDWDAEDRKDAKKREKIPGRK